MKVNRSTAFSASRPMVRLWLVLCHSVVTLVLLNEMFVGSHGQEIPPSSLDSFETVSTNDKDQPSDATEAELEDQAPQGTVLEFLSSSDMQPLEQIQQWMMQQAEEDRTNNIPSVLLALVDTDDCAAESSHHTWHAWQQASERIEPVLGTPPLMARMTMSDFSSILQQQQQQQQQQSDQDASPLLGVERVPVIAVFLWDRLQRLDPRVVVIVDNNDEAQQPHFRLFQESCHLEALFWHFHSRIVWAKRASNPLPRVTTMKEVETTALPLFSNLEQVQQFVCERRDFIFHHPPAPLPQTLTSREEKLRQELWNTVERDFPDDFTVLVQCRKYADRKNTGYLALYDTFYRISIILSERQDVFYATISDCPDQEDGSVVSWKMVARSPGTTDNGLCQPVASHTWSPTWSSTPNASSDLISFHQAQTTPSLAWFDRRLAAPVALARDTQALLFLDFHPSRWPPGLERDAARAQVVILVQAFRQACQQHRRDSAVGQDTVCLLVPSTETRILTTMGVDIWGPLDDQITQHQEHSINSNDTNPLPQLVLLDQRKDGETPLYRIKDPSVQSVSSFLNDFWQDKLRPELKTSAEATTEDVVNEFGVHHLNAANWASERFLTKNHSLILFTSPTCGHCKRAIVWFNQVSRIFGQAPGWPDLLTLYMADVTTDQIPSTIVRWLPDLVYVSPQEKAIVQYNDEEQLAGEISHYSRVMEWLLHVMELEDENQWMVLLKDLQILPQFSS